MAELPSRLSSEAVLEKAARTALSHLLYDGPAAVERWEAIEALVAALEPYDEEDDRAAT